MASSEISDDSEIVPLELGIIQEVQKRPLLWNKNEEEYMNVTKKTLAWRDIAAALNTTEGKL